MKILVLKWVGFTAFFGSDLLPISECQFVGVPTSLEFCTAERQVAPAGNQLLKTMTKQTKGHSIAKINAQAGVLELRITGQIYFGWTASDFRYEVDRALKEGITSAEVYLNTAGGSVYEATEIVNQLKRLKSVTISTGALVASAGTYIMAHFPAKAYKSSQFMIHKPITEFYGNIDQMRADLKHLENVTEQYKEVYAKRFGKTSEDIDELWKQDYWLNAMEAKEIGLISEIVDGEPEITTETVAMMQACGCKSLPKPNKVINSKNIEKMDRDTLISALGMASDATDEQIKERIQALKEQEAKRAVEAKDRAEKLVNKAIFDKKITADKKDLYVGLAEADYDKTATLLEAIEAPRPASQTITPAKSAVEDRSTWTMEDYLTKDPDALDALMVSDPQKVKELNAMYQQKNK